MVGAQSGIALHRGVTWTTDAPYCETEAAILRARDQGALAVEMEAAAPYAVGTTRGHSVVRFAM
jgi:purine-nucleoside phosphorylase